MANLGDVNILTNNQGGTLFPNPAKGFKPERTQDLETHIEGIKSVNGYRALVDEVGSWFASGQESALHLYVNSTEIKFIPKPYSLAKTSDGDTIAVTASVINFI